MPEIPKVDVKAKLTSLNESIRTAHIPSPQEMKDGYMNSNVHKSFSQTLSVRTRVEDVDVQKAREFMTQKKTPAELSQMNHPLDIPLPKIKLPSLRTITSSGTGDEGGDHQLEAANKTKQNLYETFPRSALGQKNIVTSHRIIADEDAQIRKELVKTRTPAQLAEINSIGDFPIPSKVKSFLSPSERKIMSQKQMHQRKMSATSAKSDRASDTSPWRLLKIGNIFKNNEAGTKIKRSKSETALETGGSSWNRQKLVTNVKVEVDKEELNRRRALAASKSPAELSQIHSVAEIPIPGTLKRIVTGKPVAASSAKNSATAHPLLSKSLTDLPVSGSAAAGETSGFSVLTKSAFNAQCLVRSRVEDPLVQKERAELVKNRTVAQLSQITSLSDIPIPKGLQTLADRRGGEKSKNPVEVIDDKKQVPKTMQDYIPDGLKSQLLVISKTGHDQDVIRERQELVRSKSPSELSQFHRVGDIPIPSVLQISRPTSPFPTMTAAKE